MRTEQTKAVRKDGRLRKSTIQQIEHALSLLFPTVRVVVAPNRQSELWVKDAQGYGMRVTMGAGKAGVSVTMSKFTGGSPITMTGNSDGTMQVLPQQDAFEVTCTAYRNDERSQAFKSWYGGKGEYPEDINTHGYTTVSLNG